MPHEKYYHLLEPLPDFMQVIAFLDRIHAYVPGWEIPKLSHDSYAKDYGFIADYFCEIMHEMRHVELLSAVRSRFDLIDTANTGQGISGRDQRAAMKTVFQDCAAYDAGIKEVILPTDNVKEAHTLLL